MELSAGEHSEWGFPDMHRYRLCPRKEVSECMFYMVGADSMSLGSRLPSHLPTLTGIPYMEGMTLTHRPQKLHVCRKPRG